MESTMNMDNCGFESDVTAIEYDDEIMNAGWNPVIELVCEMLRVPDVKHPAELAHMESVADVSAGISDVFLKKIYSYQR